MNVSMPEATPPRRVDDARQTVLVVDDQDAVRQVCCLALDQCGYRVLAAEGGAAAVRIFREHAGEIELLVTDVLMPGMNGGELAHLLLEEAPGLKVLYMSGYADDPEVQREAGVGLVAFLQKPFSTAALVDKVLEVLDGRGTEPDRAHAAARGSAGEC